jgi:hypothetical protein
MSTNYGAFYAGQKKSQRPPVFLIALAVFFLAGGSAVVYLETRSAAAVPLEGTELPAPAAQPSADLAPIVHAIDPPAGDLALENAQLREDVARLELENQRLAQLASDAGNATADAGDGAGLAAVQGEVSRLRAEVERYRQGLAAAVDELNAQRRRATTASAKTTKEDLGRFVFPWTPYANMVSGRAWGTVHNANAQEVRGYLVLTVESTNGGRPVHSKRVKMAIPPRTEEDYDVVLGYSAYGSYEVKASWEME